MKFNKIQNIRSEGLPLYSHVEYLIRNKILRGQLEPGEKLPTEKQLAKQLGVSIITIRTALSRLNDEDLVIRNRPKGTFVSDNLPLQKQFIFTGGIYDIVTDAMRYEVKAIGIDAMKVGETRNSKEIQGFLNLRNEDSIGVVRRVRLLKGTPILFIENFIPTDFSKHLTLKDLSIKPLLKVLKEKIGLTIARGEMFIEAVPADADVADILQIDLFAPLILIQAYYWLTSGQPFEVVNLFMRSEYFKYKVELDAKGFERI